MICAAPTPIPSMTALTSMWQSATTATMMDNYLIRFDEIRQSLRILEQASKQIPQGPINSQKPQYQVQVPAGEAYGRIESPKGELGVLYRLEWQAKSMALSRPPAFVRQYHRS